MSIESAIWLIGIALCFASIPVTGRTAWALYIAGAVLVVGGVLSGGAIL